MHTVDTLIHIGQSLDQSKRDSCCHTVNDLNGVREAKFAVKRPHLLRVDYDPLATDATTILTIIRDLGLEAHLVAL